MRLRSIVLLAGLLTPRAASAQAKWIAIGKTSSGSQVYLDKRSVSRTGNLVGATVRVVFGTPVQTPKGPWASSRTKAVFDCGKQSLAARENSFFADVGGSRLTERTVNKLPGFGPALKGSLGQVALDYLCR